MGENPGNLGLGKALLHTTQKGRSIKEKIGKVDFINIKNFCSSKDTVRKMKTQTTDPEKHVESTYTIKDLGSKYMKNSQNSGKKTNHPTFKKWAKHLNRHFNQRKYKDDT